MLTFEYRRCSGSLVSGPPVILGNGADAPGGGACGGETFTDATSKVSAVCARKGKLTVGVNAKVIVTANAGRRIPMRGFMTNILIAWRDLVQGAMRTSAVPATTRHIEADNYAAASSFSRHTVRQDMLAHPKRAPTKL